ISEKFYNKYLNLAAENKYHLNPFTYTNSCYCTKEFTEWWDRYYSGRIMDTDVIISRLESGFTQPEIDKIRSNVKGRGKSKTSIKTVDQAIAGASNQPIELKPKEVKEETKSRKRVSGSSSETASKKMKNTVTVSTDDEGNVS
ncbi:hypothetical protein A2U01_0027884, partial [Trifolium medium]|nr:hypothetical protein [Trifolium medium]